ncbi:MAG: enoyl-CoA hydratase/isomerase family protein [Chitinophagales bacterium]|nr:enoyl-CoA hydratase/isomerase family protein [Chitinophagales bacterium]
MKTLAITQKESYSIVTLDRGKSNPMNLEMFEEILSLFQTLKEDNSVQGVIINGKENFFSSGLDLPEIMTYDRKTTRLFWQKFMEVIAELTAFPKPLISAITGHAPAGGCIVALCCDYRIMAGGEYKIGLNEVPVGIVVPRHIFELYSFWIGRHRAYQFLMEGRLMKPQQASDAGLIDIVVPTEQVLEAAERKMTQYLKFDQNTWSQTKLNLKRDIIKEVSEYDDNLLDEIVEHWFQPHVQGILNGFVAMLKKK